MEISKELIGKWKGRNVYTITLQQYIDNETICANSDYLWIISDKLDAHGYPYVIDGGDVVFAYDVQMNNLINKTRISARKKFGFGFVKAKSMPAQGKSVEWYMQHTLDILNAGMKYGEQQLAQLSRRKLD